MKKKLELEEGNPRLKTTFLQIVDNQLKANDPPETRQTLDRLLAQGFSREDAKIYIAQAGHSSSSGGSASAASCSRSSRICSPQ